MIETKMVLASISVLILTGFILGKKQVIEGDRHHVIDLLSKIAMAVAVATWVSLLCFTKRAANTLDDDYLYHMKARIILGIFELMNILFFLALTVLLIKFHLKQLSEKLLLGIIYGSGVLIWYAVQYLLLIIRLKSDKKFKYVFWTSNPKTSHNSLEIMLVDIFMPITTLFFGFSDSKFHLMFFAFWGGDVTYFLRNLWIYMILASGVLSFFLGKRRQKPSLVATGYSIAGLMVLIVLTNIVLRIRLKKKLKDEKYRPLR